MRSSNNNTYTDKPFRIVDTPDSVVKDKIALLVRAELEVEELIGRKYTPDNNTVLGNLVRLTGLLRLAGGGVRGHDRFSLAVISFNVNEKTTDRTYQNDRDEGLVTVMDGGTVCYRFSVEILGRGVRKSSRFANIYVPVGMFDLKTRAEMRAAVIKLWHNYLEEELVLAARRIKNLGDSINQFDKLSKPSAQRKRTKKV